MEEPTGEEYHIEEEMDERRPFKCLLDVGIVSTTVGEYRLRRVFSSTSEFV